MARDGAAGGVCREGEALWLCPLAMPSGDALRRARGRRGRGGGVDNAPRGEGGVYFLGPGKI